MGLMLAANAQGESMRPVPLRSPLSPAPIPQTPQPLQSPDDKLPPAQIPTEAPKQTDPFANIDTSEDNTPIGVASCDSYLSAMQACVSKLPQDLQNGTRLLIHNVHTQFKDTATAPEARGVLQKSCESYVAEARNSFGTVYGCQF